MQCGSKGFVARNAPSGILVVLVGDLGLGSRNGERLGGFDALIMGGRVALSLDLETPIGIVLG